MGLARRAVHNAARVAGRSPTVALICASATADRRGAKPIRWVTMTRFESMTKIMSSGSTKTPCAWTAPPGMPAGPPEPAHPVHALGVPGALHASGSAVPRTGWAPQLRHGAPRGAAGGRHAAYLKSHSYGEYVFDWAWADAYQRHGLRYYPKLLVAVPFTPVPGTPPAGHDDAARHTPAGRLGPGGRGRARRRRTCCSMTTTTAPPSPRRLDAARRRAVPLDPGPGGPAWPTSPPSGQPAARQAQEDPARAAPRGRGRASPSPCTRAPDRRRPVGLLPPVLHASPTAAHHSPRPT
jgi:hypothetical protein